MTEEASYEERHALAADTFAVFVPGVEPERVAASFARRLGALGGFAFDVVGEMWARPELSRRDRSLIVVATLAAQARDEELELHTGVALRNGLTRVELEEIIVTVAAYAGFPAAMAASRRVDDALRTAAGIDRLSDRIAPATMPDAERDRAGADVYRIISGGREGHDPQADLAYLSDALGEVGVLAYRWVFGEIWSRDELSRRDRSLAVIAVLISLGAVDELAVHVPAGIGHGLSREEIEAAITHLALYAGLPCAVEAMRAARAGLRPVGPVTADGLVLLEPRRFELRAFEVPEIGDDDGLLRVEACGLCGTDHEQYTGHIPSRHAFIPGHEVVGTIEEVGARAAERWGVRAGQRVAVEVFQSCQHVPPVEVAFTAAASATGSPPWWASWTSARPPGLWGGYATLLYLGPDAMLLPIPDDLDPVLATMFNPLGAGIRWAVDLPGTEPGDVVAILGPGVRGICAAAAARNAGAGFIMVTGRGPRDADRLALATSFGADLGVDVASDDPNRALRAATGGLADVVVDVTAKAPAAFAQAISLARTGGTVVVAGTRGTPEAPEFNPDHLVYKELRVLGALGVDVAAYRPALDLLAGGRYPFADLPREVVGFDDLEPGGCLSAERFRDRAVAVPGGVTARHAGGTWQPSPAPAQSGARPLPARA